MASNARFAEVAALAGDMARASMLHALMDGRALTASELARVAGIAPQTATAHLARMTEAGLLSMQKQGRHRYHRLASPAVAQMMESIMQVAASVDTARLPTGPRDKAVRAARTCYDHLAGRLGVAVFGALIERGYVLGGDRTHDLDADGHDRLSAPGRDRDYRLTQVGGRRFGELGVILPDPGRDGTIPLRYCVDWTEQRHHLSGTVGRALLDRLLELRWVRRAQRGRAVHVTDEGRAGLHMELGVEL